MTKEPIYSADDEGYFGVTFLNLDSYGAHLVSNTIRNTEIRGSKLWFDEALPRYDGEHRALTVEGFATQKASPDFAIQALSAYAKVARDMDELARPFAS